MTLLRLALTFGLLSILSIGGINASLPEMHREIVTNLHWMDDQTFANTVAIAQSAPGPNLLIVSMIGWQVAGLAGMVVATLAMILPAMALAITASRVVERYASIAWVARLRQALAPIAVGLMLASGYVMSRAACDGLLPLVVIFAVTGLVYMTDRSPLWGIAGGALAAIVTHRLRTTGF